MHQNFFLFTVDVEDWFQVENFKASIPFDTWNDRDLRVERNTHQLLDLFDEMREGSRGQGFKGSRVSSQTNKGVPHTGVRIQEPGAASRISNVPNKVKKLNKPNKQSLRATFFVLGWIAERLPELVREIHSRGHEIASHGANHGLCTDQTINALRKDLTESKKLLEDIIGGQVQGYRAPSFSINNEILQIIEEAGYSYDSSYNSFDKHGRYGKLSVNDFTKNGIGYKISDYFYELPVSNLSLKPIAHSLQPAVLPLGGGGYFRLIPYSVFRKGVQRILKNDGAYSFYLHPWEVDPDQPRVENVPAFMKFRHYVNLASTAAKIRTMLHDFRDCRFVTCGEYVEAVAKEGP